MQTKPAASDRERLLEEDERLAVRVPGDTRHPEGCAISQCGSCVGSNGIIIFFYIDMG